MIEADRENHNGISDSLWRDLVWAVDLEAVAVIYRFAGDDTGLCELIISFMEKQDG